MPYDPSSYALASSKPQIWNPKDILQLDNPDRGYITCAGGARTTRRRCQNRVAASKYSQRMLYTLATKDALKAAVSDMLPQATEFMLCHHHKGNQASAVTRQWKSRLEAWDTEQGQESSSSAAPTTHHHLVIRTKVADTELGRGLPSLMERPRDAHNRGRYEQSPEPGAEMYGLREREQGRRYKEEEGRMCHIRRECEQRRREEDALEKIFRGRERERSRAVKIKQEREAEEEGTERRKLWGRDSPARWESTAESRPRTDVSVSETTAKLMQLLGYEVMDGPSEDTLALILKVLTVLHQEAQGKRGQ